MSAKSRGRAYQVGEYWIAQEPSGNYSVNWYDRNKRQTRRKSLGTGDFQEAKQRLTDYHLSQIRPENQGDLTVRQVSLKYWNEHAKNLDSSDAARVSLDRLNEFLTSREIEPLAENWTRADTADFITWLKSGDYNGRDISDNTVNRTIAVVRAAFRHCMERPPTIHGLKGVQARGGKKKPTLTKQQVKDLFAYAFASKDRQHLQQYLLAAFTTLARPEAILDIQVTEEAGQIEWDYRLLHLNPEGREQTNKHRPAVPINDYLLPMLQFQAESSKSGYLVEYNGKRLSGIRQTWNKAKKALGWPGSHDCKKLKEDGAKESDILEAEATARAWDAKMIRHTMSKHLRAVGAPWPEIQGQLGHSIKGQSEIYAEYDPNYLGHVQAEITRYLDEFLPEILRGSKSACVPFASRSHKGVVSIKQKTP